MTDELYKFDKYIDRLKVKRPEATKYYLAKAALGKAAAEDFGVTIDEYNQYLSMLKTLI